jgi:hypothetical protein
MNQYFSITESDPEGQLIMDPLDSRSPTLVLLSQDFAKNTFHAHNDMAIIRIFRGYIKSMYRYLS